MPPEWRPGLEADLLAELTEIKQFPATSAGDPREGLKLKFVKTSEGEMRVYAIGTEGGCNIAAGNIVLNIGPHEWRKPPRGWASLSNDREKKAIAFEVTSDRELVVLEMIPDGSRRPEDCIRCKPVQ